MVRKTWSDAFDELNDYEFSYNVFRKKSLDMNSSQDGWDFLGVKTYKETSNFILEQKFHKRFAPIHTYDVTYYTFRINEEYLHIKVQKNAPI